MWKQLFKIVWKQRRTNGWIFGEILIVLGLLWVIIDGLIVDYRIYHTPLGFDIENTHRLKLAFMGEASPGYVPADQITMTGGEQVLLLMDRIRRNPEVVEVSASTYAFPYSWANSQRSISPVDVDSTLFTGRVFPVRFVMPEFFTVFGIKDKDGNEIPPQLEPARSCIVISKDMEELFYGNGNAKGRYCKNGDDELGTLIAAATQPYRDQDNVKSEPCIFNILDDSYFAGMTENSGINSLEICLRMRSHKTEHEMNEFLSGMGDLLTVNNLYVMGSFPIEKQRLARLKDYHKSSKTYISLVAFLLVNVLFGIIGTFWLRTQYRKGEIGLRVALGSSRQGIFRFLNMEGLCLLMITLPILLFFAGNMIWFDHLDSYRLPVTAGRLFTSLGGTYLLIAGMIWLGISFPAYKATKLPPAEALHYE